MRLSSIVKASHWLEWIVSMKRWSSAAIVVFAWTAVIWAAPSPLTSVRAIQALTAAEINSGAPLAFEATVSYYRGDEHMLYAQDAGEGIYVRTPADARLIPGDRVLVRGKARNGFRTWVMSDTVTRLRHDLVPKPVPASFDELIRAQHDCVLVNVRAVVRSADPAWGGSGPTYLQMLTSSGYIDAVLDSDDANARRMLLDAEVEVTGVATGKLDGKQQFTGIKLFVSTLANVKILKRASVDPGSLPITPMDLVLTGSRPDNQTHRIRVRGIITYYQPGAMVVLQNGSQSLRIMTQAHTQLRIGDMADATGFPGVQEGFLALTYSEVQDSHVLAPVAPVPVTTQDLMSSAHIFDLVSIEGKVVSEVREASRDEYVLFSDGHQFSVMYQHPDGSDPSQLPPIRQIPLESRVRVTGVCSPTDSNPNNGPVPFDLLMRSLADITVIAEPSWLNVRNLTSLVTALSVVILVVVIWVGLLDGRLREKTGIMAKQSQEDAIRERRLARQEQERSQILELVSSPAPLPEVLEEIQTMVSSRLYGAPCWFELLAGAEAGAAVKRPDSHGTVFKEMFSPDGASLGFLLAAPLQQAAPNSDIFATLQAGARLAELAINTRQLYSDLRHRSEYDLLTDIPNRFSMESKLDQLMLSARRNEAVFGLIYIDLDRFKQVNDRYGHGVGDLYLKEVTRRMKLQLRTEDMLARIGGDEFIALVPILRGRVDAEEIAIRLERCFDEPFDLGGFTLQGSASVGLAVYPKDGVTEEGLQRSADAAMYVHKEAKRHSSLNQDQPTQETQPHGSESSLQ
jgi:diguanylate cyclase (GGDEF)-like protein